MFTVWPFVYMLLFMGLVFGCLLWMQVGQGEAPARAGLPAPFMLLLVLHLLTVLDILGLLVFYIVHLFHTPLIESDRRALWAVVLFFGNLFAMPVYWYLYLWRPLRPGAMARAGLTH